MIVFIYLKLPLYALNSLALSPSYPMHEIYVKDGALCGLVGALVPSIDLNTEADGP